MESVSAYILTSIIALVFLLISIVVANAIKYQGGSNPKDSQKRRIWFWILAVLNPVVCLLAGYFIFKPDANVMVVSQYITALLIGTGIAFLLYLLLGFLLSKLFKKRKLGHWF